MVMNWLKKSWILLVLCAHFLSGCASTPSFAPDMTDIPLTRKLDAVLEIEESMKFAYRFQGKEYIEEIPVSAYGSISIQEALDEYRRLSIDEKNQDAMYALGTYYRINYDIPDHYKLAFECFNQLDKDGYIPGTHSLAYLYLSGYGVEKNKDKALEYYKKAGDAGYLLSLKNLAVLYNDGFFISAGKRDETVLEYMKKAASVMEPQEADIYVSNFYINSFDTLPNLKKAEKLLKKANRNNPKVIENFALLYGPGSLLHNDKKEPFYYRKLVEQEAAENKKNREKFLELLPYLLEQEKRGVTDCYTKIAFCYNPIKKICPDEKKYYEYKLKAAEAGSPDAMRFVGNAYAKGIHFTQNARKGCNWMTKSFDANPGEKMTVLELFDFYEKTVVGLSDYLKKAVSGHLYRGPGYYEDFSEISYKETFNFYKMILENEKAPLNDTQITVAKQALAYFYQFGIGTEKNEKLSKEYGYKELDELRTPEDYYDEKNEYLKNRQNRFEKLYFLVQLMPDADAYYEMAKFFLDFNDYESAERASFYLLKAAKMGNAEALAVLAGWFMQGKVVEYDFAIALALYEESIALGNNRVINEVVRMYRYGYGTEQNCDKEIEYLLMDDFERRNGRILNRYLTKKQLSEQMKNYEKQ